MICKWQICLSPQFLSFRHRYLEKTKKEYILSGRYPDTQIIWITSDGDFASVAIRRHIHDFIVRPFTEERFAKSVKDVLPKCPHRYEWHFSPGKRLRGRVI